MLALSRPVRSETELAAWRAQAQDEHDSWGVSSAYVRETRAAALAAFDWLLGRTTTAPATGAQVGPDDVTIPAERLRAERLEDEGGDAAHSARYYGRVGLVLCWALRDPDIDSPL